MQCVFFQRLFCGSVRKLDVENCTFGPQPEHVYFAAIASRIKEQVQELCSNYPALAKPSLHALCAVQYPVLQKLSVCSTAVDDAAMDLLLQNLKNLHHLEVSEFQLKTDYSSRQCSWRSLAMTHVDIASLPYLPTSANMSGPRYGCASDIHLVNLGHGEGVDLQRTAEAVTSMLRYGGLRHCGGDAIVNVPVTSPPHMDKVLLASIPLLHTVFDLQLHGVKVGRELLTALGKFPELFRLALGNDCTFEMGIWGHMVALLPHVQDLHVYTAGISLRQMLVLCVAANHKIKLWLTTHQFDEDNEEWYNELQRVLRDSGHDHVTVQRTMSHNWWV